MSAIARAAAGRVERGVTGKEKMFQQSREFGPGPIKPYLSKEPTPQPRFRPRPIPSGGEYRQEKVAT